MLAEGGGGAAVLAMVAYALLAGADFGGGVWDALSRGPRRTEARAAIDRAMGPVWEANHVWLIFLVVLFFTCFPRAFSAYSEALFVPLHLVLVGITLRGVSFVFRHYAVRTTTARRWGVIFGASSVVTPVLLGACVGAISAGGIELDGDTVRVHGFPWLSPIAVAMGAAGLSLCAYLAAVFLTVETEGDLREDFRKRALIAGAVVVVGSFLTIPLLRLGARHLWEGLLRPPALYVVLFGAVASAVAWLSLLLRRNRLARVAAGAQVASLIVGWALSQYPYVIYPSLTLAAAASPPATLRFVLLTAIPGAALLAPSLWWLFRVFKTRAA